jgi:ribonuclease HII
MAKQSKSAEVTVRLYAFDREADAAHGACVIGVDEAGRGPLAGPVVAAAVLLDPERPIAGVNDSKKLSPARRDKLYDCIVAQARAWAVAEASVAEIEKLNILQASLLAMQRAIDQISLPWSVALIDGNQPLRTLAAGRQRTVVRGDASSASIAAASIIAKVTRDRVMTHFHERYPMYDFISNKGYGTPDHCRSIALHGLCEIHRPSFCASLAGQTRLALD